MAAPCNSYCGEGEPDNEEPGNPEPVFEDQIEGEPVEKKQIEEKLVTPTFPRFFADFITVAPPKLTLSPSFHPTVASWLSSKYSQASYAEAYPKLDLSSFDFRDEKPVFR